MLRRGPFVLQTSGFVMLCLWASAGWIWGEALPAQMGSVAGQGFHFLLIGLAMVVWSLLRQEKRSELSANGWTALAGLALFAGPMLLLHTAQGRVSSSLGVVVFALLPVVLMVVSGELKGLVRALLGVAGVLVLLPVSMPEGRGLLGTGLVVVAMFLTALAMVWLHRLLPQSSWGWAMAVVCLSNGAVLTLAGWSEAAWTWDAARYEALRGLAIDAPEVLLLLGLIGTLEPRRVAARWLVAPLFTVLEGYVLMRPKGGVRLLAGIALLGFGGLWVFAGKGEDEPETTGLGLA